MAGEVDRVGQAPADQRVDLLASHLVRADRVGLLPGRYRSRPAFGAHARQHSASVARCGLWVRKRRLLWYRCEKLAPPAVVSNLSRLA